MKHSSSSFSFYFLGHDRHIRYSFLDVSKFYSSCVRIGLPVVWKGGVLRDDDDDDDADWKGVSSGQRWVDEFKMAEYDPLC